MSGTPRPCPFCGGLPYQLEVLPPINVCSKCKIELGEEAWDRRPIEDELVATLERITKANPHAITDGWGHRDCIHCDEDHPNHDPTCAYVAAIAIIAKAKGAAP